MNIRSALPLLVVVMGLWLFAACTTEEYESGDGKYSYLRTDFVEAHSGEAKKVVYATTDEGDSLVFRGGADCSWTTTPDSIYRGLLYSARDGETAPYTHFVSMSPVLVLNVPEKKREKLVTDPLTLESAWVSANGKYLNLGLCVKTGADESDEKKTHLLGVDRDTLFQHVDGRHELHLILYHDQGGVPEYYTTNVYASIPIGQLAKGDVIKLDVQTYNGQVSRTFIK